MSRIKWGLLLSFGMSSMTTVWASEIKCENEINRLLKKWHLSEDRMTTDRITSLGVRQIGHTEVSYKTIERSTYASKEEAEKANPRLFSEWPKSETPSLYGQQVSIKEFPPYGVSLQYEGLVLAPASTGKFQFKHSSMSMTFNSECKIEKLFFQDPNLVISAHQCNELKNISAPQDHSALASSVNQVFHLNQFPAVVDQIIDQCHDSNVVLGMLQLQSDSKTDSVNRRIASEPIETEKAKK